MITYDTVKYVGAGSGRVAAGFEKREIPLITYRTAGDFNLEAELEAITHLKNALECQVFDVNDDGTIKPGKKIVKYNSGMKVEVEYVTVLCEDDSEEVLADKPEEVNNDDNDGGGGAGEEAEVDGDKTETDDSDVVPVDCDF